MSIRTRAYNELDGDVSFSRVLAGPDASAHRLRHRFADMPHPDDLHVLWFVLSGMCAAAAPALVLLAVSLFPE